MPFDKGLKTELHGNVYVVILPHSFTIWGVTSFLCGMRILV
jgi:hypothetical protein